MKRKTFIAYLAAIVTILIWGETFVSTKIVLSHGMRPADLFVLRFLIAYAGMWLIARKKIFANSLKDELLMLGLGLSGGSLYFLTENSALAISNASNVALIVSSTPIATALILAIFYKDERMSRSQILGSLVAFIGMALVIFNGEVILKLDPRGDLLALGAVLSWGLYSLLMKMTLGKYDVGFITRKVFGYGLLTMVPYFMTCGWPQLSVEAASSPAVWGNILYLGIVASLACFLSWNWCLNQLGTVRTTNLIYLQPFFTMLVGAAILGEKITWMALAGTAILILGMYKTVK